MINNSKILIVLTILVISSIFMGMNFVWTANVITHSNNSLISSYGLGQRSKVIVINRSKEPIQQSTETEVQRLRNKGVKVIDYNNNGLIDKEDLLVLSMRLEGDNQESLIKTHIKINGKKLNVIARSTTTKDQDLIYTLYYKKGNLQVIASPKISAININYGGEPYRIYSSDTLDISPDGSPSIISPHLYHRLSYRLDNPEMAILPSGNFKIGEAPRNLKKGLWDKFEENILQKGYNLFDKFTAKTMQVIIP